MPIAFKQARDALSKIRRHSNRCLIIHYACQSLYDDREGLSPSISNIVVKSLSNDQTVSFAAHLVAERLHIKKEDIVSKFDEIERALLADFYEFVQSQSSALWIHWNMVNIHYGFDMLAHRQFVLTGKNAPTIDIDNRLNLAGILQGIYGPDYVGTPHMAKLMEVNGGARRDFVLGKDEVELFKAGEFSRLHASTLCKVRFFTDVVQLTLDKKLKTQQSGWYIKFESATDGLWAKLVGLIAATYTLVDLTMKAVSAVSSG